MAIEAARLAVIVDAVTDGAERGLDRIGHSINRSGGMIRDVASTAFGFLSAQAVMHGTAAVGSMMTLGIETQNAMNIFESVTGASGDTMARVSALARELGNDITLPGTSAKDATLAMVELAKAGLSVEDTMAAAQGTLQLAAAAEVDAATAATIAANNLNAFGLAGSEANRVADLLAAAANASSGEMTDMAAAMQMSSTVFAQAGMTIDELTTAIGQMANKGIQGSDAGTSLKTMMLALMAPTKEAQKALDSMGISLRDADGNMRPMRDLIAQFTQATSGMGAAQRDAALKTIFGTDAIRAANVVLAGGVEAYDAMHEAVTKQGAAAEVSAARMKGLGGALEGLKSNIETVLIDAFMVAAPILERVVRWAGEQLPNALAVAGRVFGEVSGAVQAFIAAFRAGDGDVTSSGMAGALERIAFVARQVWDEIVNAWPQIQATAQQVFSTVMEVLGSVVSWVQEHWPEISAVITEVMTTVQTIISTVLEAIAAFWRTWGGTITDLVTSIFDGVRQVIDGALNIIRGVIDTVMGLIRGDWDRAWDGIREALSGVWTVLQGIVDLALDAMRLAIEAGMRLIAGVLDAAWDAIRGAASGAWNGMRSLAQTGIDNVFAAISALPGRIRGLAGAMLDAGKQIATDMLRGIGDALAGGWDFATGIIGDIASGIKHAMNDILSKVEGWINDGLDVADKMAGPWVNFGEVHLPRFHTGGVVPGVGDVLAILQGGETVFTRDQMRELGRVIGAGGTGGRASTIVVQNTFRIGAIKDKATATHFAAQVTDFQRRILVRPQVAIAARGAR